LQAAVALAVERIVHTIESAHDRPNPCNLKCIS
jgi:hypothetical protein